MLRSDFISIYAGQVLCEDEDFLCAFLCSALSPFIVSALISFQGSLPGSAVTDTSVGVT